MRVAKMKVSGASCPGSIFMISRIGLRREDKNQWERRVPLSPDDIVTLTRDHGLGFSIQPFPRRAFADEEFARAGVKIDESLEGCPIVLGIKEMPIDYFKRQHTYLFFSHTIKGQGYNMPMLQRLLDLGCNLLDYEKITDDYGKRLVFFGVEAGQAGMINTLWALGRRLACEGIQSPFGEIKQALEYGVLAEAEKSIRSVGEKIIEAGIPSALHPLVCGFAGYGNVSRGAQHVYDCLPVKEITPKELLNAGSGTFESRHHVYKVVFKEEDMVENISPAGGFNLREYYDRPELYKGTFERYVPLLTLLVNCIFWTPDYPRLVTKQNVHDLYSRDGVPKLRVIGDISCDVEGSVEVTMKVTDSGNPIFVADINTGKPVDGVEGRGPVVLAVDNLPCELPREASERFSTTLAPLIPSLAKADLSVEFEDVNLPPVWKRAIICYHGRLTPDYEYLSDYL
jgi:saccharopine dehydrogenase (NAD+, L-lysine-forming)